MVPAASMALLTPPAFWILDPTPVFTVTETEAEQSGRFIFPEPHCVSVERKRKCKILPRREREDLETANSQKVEIGDTLTQGVNSNSHLFQGKPFPLCLCVCEF